MVMNRQETAGHRWTVPFAGFLLSLMGGMSYAWGIFVLPLSEKFGWTTAEATLPFTVFMVVFAIVMVPAGSLQDKYGPRKIAIIGALLFFVAYATAALVSTFPYLWWLLLTYGVIGGTACGLTYACVAPPTRKWFPDKPGTAISFAVMGFGLAAVIFAPLKARFLIPDFGLEGTFLIIGILVLVVSLFASIFIINPPHGWHAPPVASGHSSKTVSIKQELEPGELPGKVLFWVLWLVFAFVIAGGLMCISLIPAYGKKIIDLSVGEAAVAMSIFAAFNGFGRPLAGMLSDKFGAVTVMIVSYAVQAVTLLSFTTMATSLFSLYLAAALLGWGFAVTLAVFPALTSICFGVKHLGMNYGMVFTAFGVGAFASFIGAWLFDSTGSYTPAFTLAGLLAVLGLSLCVVLKKKYALA
jgi:OFA family oxalate/formate antiporter-like MFS transporter